MKGASWTIVGLMIGALSLGACGRHAEEDKDCSDAVKAKTFSGFCVPRYVSLKRGEVIGRKGPGKDYPPVFVYHRIGTPVQVVWETEDWRRICDPDGGAVWVHRSMIDGRRTVMTKTPTPIRRDPKPDGAVTGMIAANDPASLGKCKDGWCKVKTTDASGWVAMNQVWGAAPGAQCH